MTEVKTENIEHRNFIIENELRTYEYLLILRDYSSFHYSFYLIIINKISPSVYWKLYKKLMKEKEKEFEFTKAIYLYPIFLRGWMKFWDDILKGFALATLLYIFISIIIYLFF